MRKEDLFNMELGEYNLTDNIYNYTLLIGLTSQKERFYRIMEKGSLSMSSIFLTELIEDECDNENKTFYAIAIVGGISVHFTDTFDILNKLKLI